MLKNLWRILTTDRYLMDEAHSKTSEMLNETRRMCEIVIHAITEDVGDDFRHELSRMDSEVNQKEIEVRKKVYEHLAMSQGDNLLVGLILTRVVSDIERIGDYTKNIGDLASLFRGHLEFNENEDRFQDFVRRVQEFFRLTQLAFFGHDEKAAKVAQESYHQLASDADEALASVLAHSSKDELVKKSDLALVLLLRYLKRTGAHLKNICTTVINPYPEIGYLASQDEKTKTEADMKDI